jgi:hypothetical protein
MPVIGTMTPIRWDDDTYIVHTFTDHWNGSSWTLRERYGVYYKPMNVYLHPDLVWRKEPYHYDTREEAAEAYNYYLA